MTALAELQKRRRDVRVIGLLSRAEEVGFHGALAAAKNTGAVGRTSWAKLPTNSVVISLETSRELPGVKMGEGVIIRVGDKASIFHSDASRFLTEIAAGLTGKIKGFKYQRALMSGGTCEATAFQEFGLDSAAVCVALGNYHNCGENNRIRAEYVSFEDVVNMTELLVSAALKLGKFNQLVEKLPKRLNRLLREAQTELPKNA